jgi:hypothetical protein
MVVNWHEHYTFPLPLRRFTLRAQYKRICVCNEALRLRVDLILNLTKQECE